MVAYTYMCINFRVDPSAMRSFHRVRSSFFFVAHTLVGPGETDAARNFSLLSPSECLTRGERKVRFTLVRCPAAFHIRYVQYNM